MICDISDHAQRVRDFMRKAGQNVRTTPCQPPDEELIRAVTLIHEEFLELARAAGVQITLQVGNELALEHPKNQYGYAVTGEFDLIEYADACGDISVTTQGALAAAGIPDVPLLEEIDRSNLERFGPGSYRRDDGKWVRGPDWTPPDIAGVLGINQEVCEVCNG